jgi:hypothetical protein
VREASCCERDSGTAAIVREPETLRSTDFQRQNMLIVAALASPQKCEAHVGLGVS